MKKFLAMMMIALLAITIGCTQQENDKTNESSPKTTTDESKLKPKQTMESTKNSPSQKENSLQSMKVKVYFPDNSGMHLIEVERAISFKDDNEKYLAAVESMMTDPSKKNLTCIFPNNAKITSIKVRDGVADVDFDKSILKGLIGGSTGEEFLIGSIVDTLTNFPEIKRVKFFVDGESIETLSGHMDLSKPLDRMENLIK